MMVAPLLFMGQRGINVAMPMSQLVIHPVLRNWKVTEIVKLGMVHHHNVGKTTTTQITINRILYYKPFHNGCYYCFTHIIFLLIDRCICFFSNSLILWNSFACPRSVSVSWRRRLRTSLRTPSCFGDDMTVMMAVDVFWWTETDAEGMWLGWLMLWQKVM